MKFFYCSVLILLCGCSSTTPIGPKIAVMPAPGKPFDQFVGEETICRQYASSTISGAPKSASNTAAGSIIAGTALGTAAGALIGGRQGAPVGAGVGLIVGSGAASGQQGYEARDIQWSYDNAYAQCMYSKGNQVPGFQTQQSMGPPPSTKTERK
jgi:uncharacterized membrane protein YebE (DUF533 family)